MEILQEVEERFAQHKELERMREFLVWALPWISSEVNRAIGEVFAREATEAFDLKSPRTIMSLDDRYARAFFDFGYQLHVRGAWGYGGFGIEVDGNQDANLENRLNSHRRVMTVYGLLPQILQHLCTNVPGLEARLQRTLFKPLSVLVVKSEMDEDN